MKTKLSNKLEKRCDNCGLIHRDNWSKPEQFYSKIGHVAADLLESSVWHHGADPRLINMMKYASGELGRAMEDFKTHLNQSEPAIVEAVKSAFRRIAAEDRKLTEAEKDVIKILFPYVTT